MTNDQPLQNENLSQHVYDLIKEKKLKPKPRWSFLLKNYIFWGCFVLSLSIGSLAVAVAIFMTKNNDWDIHERMNFSPAKFFIATLPYFWLIVLIIFIIFAHYYLRHTKTGYRYSLLIITLICIGGSVLLGALAHLAGIGELAENNLSKKIPYYRNLNFNRATMWVQPDNGLLAGTIIKLYDDDIFFLDDFTNHIWNINAGQARLRDGLKVDLGVSIKIIGEKIDEKSFRAFEIRPWGATCIMDRCSMQYRNNIIK